MKTIRKERLLSVLAISILLFVIFILTDDIFRWLKQGTRQVNTEDLGTVRCNPLVAVCSLWFRFEQQSVRMRFHIEGELKSTRSARAMLKLQPDGHFPVQSVQLTFSLPGVDLPDHSFYFQRENEAVPRSMSGSPVLVWRAGVALPAEVSGRKDWLSELEIHLASGKSIVVTHQLF